jgi:hypothetical protein
MYVNKIVKFTHMNSRLKIYFGQLQVMLNIGFKVAMIILL